jgi:hypothetical protein
MSRSPALREGSCVGWRYLSAAAFAGAQRSNELNSDRRDVLDREPRRSHCRLYQQYRSSAADLGHPYIGPQYPDELTSFGGTSKSPRHFRTFASSY